MHRRGKARPPPPRTWAPQPSMTPGTSTKHDTRYSLRPKLGLLYWLLSISLYGLGTVLDWEAYFCGHTPGLSSGIQVYLEGRAGILGGQAYLEGEHTWRASILGGQPQRMARSSIRLTPASAPPPCSMSWWHGPSSGRPQWLQRHPTSLLAMRTAHMAIRTLTTTLV